MDGACYPKFIALQERVLLMVVKQLLILVWEGEADTFVKGNNQDTRSMLALRLCGNDLGSGWNDQQDLTHSGRIRTNAIAICRSRTVCYADLLILHNWGDCRGRR
jgi:hypothetical protein